MTTTPEDLTQAHRAVLDALDEQWMVDELRRLVRVPSLTASDAESDPDPRVVV